MEIRERYRPLLLFLLALILNGAALALSRNYLDGDAHTRTYMALQWLKDPFFISRPNDVTWVFGPLHCYLNAFALWIWEMPTLTPRLLSCLLTSLTIFPIYYSVRLAFGNREALYSTLLFCFYTLFIHPAAITASEGINLLFIFLGIWFFLRHRRSSSWIDLLGAALSLMLATSMRYEGWVIPGLLTLILLWPTRQADLYGDSHGFLSQIPRALTFGLVGHAFILMWIISCWQQWGDPLYFLHYSGNLDAPLIAERIKESGALKFMAYNLAFLPAVMFISFPATTLVVALVGFWRTLRRNPGNLFILLFVLYLILHLILFVFSLQRYPLARFMTLPGAFFLVFAGTGVVYLRGRLKPITGKILVAILVVVAAANVGFLSLFSQPSQDDIKEKLRAVSPVTRPPDFFCETTHYCDSLLALGGELVMDARNYNDRLLYLSLYKHRDRIYQQWRDNDELRRFIQLRKPQYVLYTDYPSNNHALFELVDSNGLMVVSGLMCTTEARIGIFTLFKRSRIAL